MVKWCTRRILVVLVVFVITLLVSYHLTLTADPHETQLTDMNEEDIDDMQLILHVAQRIGSRGKPVLITILNDAYIPFANSWLCNTILMGIQEQVLFIVTDTGSRDNLARQWPNVHVVALSGEQDLSGVQKFQQAGYMRILIRRAEIVMELLKHELEVLLFEVDCVWLTDPIPECQKQIQGYDMVATGVSNRPEIIGGGFLFMKPTAQMLALWEKLTEKLLLLLDKIEYVNVTQEVAKGENDQTYLSRLISNGFANIRVNVMPLDKFADGRWYKKSRSERRHLHPMIINNNWISKNKGKISRARRFHHWFWKASQKCDMNLVKSKID